jgi:hypothetical protein
LRAIIAGDPTDRCGFWLGNLADPLRPLRYRRPVAIPGQLGDDLRWIRPGTYRRPDGKPMFDMRRRDLLAVARADTFELSAESLTESTHEERHRF